MQASSVADPRPFRAVLAAAVGILLLLIGVAAFRSWRDLEQSRQREATLEQQVRATREQIQQLERRIELLNRDPETIERMAREELWMARPDDLVIVLPPGAEAAPAKPAGSPSTVASSGRRAANAPAGASDG
jgi:cell division protein FtsB